MGYWDFYPNSDRSGAMRGRELRYLLVEMLHEHERAAKQSPWLSPAMTMSALITACEDIGVIFDGRASKLISDALRWEVRRGRVKRLERGLYRCGYVARGSLWRIRKRNDVLRHHLQRVYSIRCAEASPMLANTPGGLPLLT